MNVETVARDAVDLWWRSQQSSWDFAQRAAELEDERGYEKLGYATLYGWAKENLPDPPGRSTLSRLIRVGRLRRANESWQAIPISYAVEALPLAKGDPVLAEEVCRAAQSEADVRRSVRLAVPDLHQEADYKTFKLRLPLTAYEQLQRARRRIEFVLNRAAPSDEEVGDALALLVLGDEQIAQSIVAQLARRVDDPLAEVDSGALVCAVKRCRKKGPDLEQHHLVRRSKGGTAGPTAWLCHDCHQKITENVDGIVSDKWIKKLGREEDVKKWMGSNVPE